MNGKNKCNCGADARYLGKDERGEIWMCNDCVMNELQSAYENHIKNNEVDTCK